MDTNDNDVFWMVWSPQGNSPTMRHPTMRKAEAEAQRLARLHPDNDFYTLEAVEHFKVETLKRTRLVHPIPF